MERIILKGINDPHEIRLLVIPFNIGLRERNDAAHFARLGRNNWYRTPRKGFVAANVAAIDDVVAPLPEKSLDVFVARGDERLIFARGQIHQRDAHLAETQRGEKGQMFSVGCELHGTAIRFGKKHFQRDARRGLGK
jgi:hypothetical protein